MINQLSVLSKTFGNLHFFVVPRACLTSLTAEDLRNLLFWSRTERSGVKRSASLFVIFYLATIPALITTAAIPPFWKIIDPHPF